MDNYSIDKLISALIYKSSTMQRVYSALGCIITGVPCIISMV